MVDGDHDHDGRHSGGLFPSGQDIGGKGQGHHCAGGEFADHEGPTRQVAPQLTEPFPAVDVGPAPFCMAGGKTGGGQCVAVGNGPGDENRHRKPGPGPHCSWSKDREHPGPQHRTRADGGRVHGAEHTSRPGLWSGRGRQRGLLAWVHPARPRPCPVRGATSVLVRWDQGRPPTECARSR